MKVVTMVKKGWLAQSNSAQLNWPSLEASRPPWFIRWGFTRVRPRRAHQPRFRQSSAVALSAHGIRRVDGKRDGRAPCQSRAHFFDCWPLGHFADLLQQVVG